MDKKTLRYFYITKGLTVRKISKMTRYTEPSIRYQLAKNNLTNIKDSRGSGMRKDDHMDLDRFTQIEDADAAYVLGYLAWAGHRGYEDTYLISARSSQLPCLNKLLRIFKIQDTTTVKVCNFKNKGYSKEYKKYFVTISKRGLDKFLSKWYYGDPHTKPFRFPPSMPKKFLPDYLRGYLDRHTVILNLNQKDRHGNRYKEFYISSPYESFNNQLIDTLLSFGINCHAKSRTQMNGKISHGVYLSMKSIDILYNLLYSSKKDRGSQLEVNLSSVL